MLGRRWPCVFPTPDRQLLGHGFESARAIVLARRAADPSGHHPIMTKQAMAIAPKILEVDALLAERPGRQAWLIEVHPELSFLALARALEHIAADTGLPRKKRRAGRLLRREMLARVFPDSPDRIADATWTGGVVGAHDVLDAYAALWTALRHRLRHDGLDD